MPCLVDVLSCPISFVLPRLVLSCLVLSCLVLSCLVLSCFDLSCLVMSCNVLSCLISFVLPCLVLPCLVMSRLVWPCHKLFLSLCLSLFFVVSRGREAEGVWLSEYVTEFVRAEFALKSGGALLHNYTTPFQSVQLADTVQFGKVKAKGRNLPRFKKIPRFKKTSRRDKKRQDKAKVKSKRTSLDVMPLPCLVVLSCLILLLSFVVLSLLCLSAVSLPCRFALCLVLSLPEARQRVQARRDKAGS
jgi:hypothetical protein